MSEKTLDYIISVLKGESPDCAPDWYELTGFIFMHKIAGLFFSRAKRLGVELPLKADKLLSETFGRQKRKVMFMREALKEISSALTEKNAEHIFLKGSVLNNFTDGGIYTDGERISNDIDILVRPDRLSDVCDVLKELGYLQGTYDGVTGKIAEFSRQEILKRRMTRGETAPFLKPTGNAEIPYIEVDINFSLGNEPKDNYGLLEEMLSTRVLFNGKLPLYTADDEMFFLHLIMHQYKECSLYFSVARGKDLDLYKLFDIYAILKTQLLDLKRVETLAERFKVRAHAGAVLGQAGEVFGDEEILAMAEKLGAAQPEVLDYDAKKHYRWTAGIRERLCAFDSKKYLAEVNGVL